jgi:hypothetical protein
MNNGGMFKRCGCRSSSTGRLLRSHRPRLPERGHGSWYFEGWTVARWLQLLDHHPHEDSPDHAAFLPDPRRTAPDPASGPDRLSELAYRHITEMITALTSTTNRYDRTPTPSTLHRIRATLRSALNGGIRDGLLRDNPARCVEVPFPAAHMPWSGPPSGCWRGSRPVNHRLSITHGSRAGVSGRGPDVVGGRECRERC